MPSIKTRMQLIRSKELERPGGAGSFWYVIPKEKIEAKEWLLDVLEHSQEPEPWMNDSGMVKSGNAKSSQFYR